MSAFVGILTRAALTGVFLAFVSAPTEAAIAPDPARQQTFQEALGQIEAGDYQGAIVHLRGLLAGDPGLNRVRLELARAYFLAEDWTQARREFFTVLSSDIPGAVRQNIIAFLRAIDARRGWNWGLDFAFLTGGGLTRSYRADTMTLEIGGQQLEAEIDRPEPPDFGIEYSGFGELREVLVEPGPDRPGVTAGLRASLAVEDFEGENFDDVHLALAAPVTFSFPQRSFSLGPFADYRWYGGKGYEAEAGLQAQVIDRSVRNWALTLAGAVALVDGLGDDDRDATRYEVSAGAFRSIGGTAIAGARLGLRRTDAAVASESSTEYRSDLTLGADLGHGLRASLGPNLSLTVYDGKAPLFPRARRDWQAGASIRLTKTDMFLFGFNPFVALDIAWHESNIELYRYTDHGLRIGLAKSL